MGKGSPYYTSSAFFPSLDKTEDLARAEKALSELYGVERKRLYHRGLKPRDPEVFQRDLRWVLHFIQPPARVLECGAGTGTFALLLAEAGFQVTAADLYDQDDLTFLRRRYASRQELSFEHITNVLAAGNQFDAVISINVLEHIVFPDQAIRQWKKLVRVGGTLSIICPNYSGILSPLRIAFNIIRGGSKWRYRGVGQALGHCLENIVLNIRIALTGQPVFVRCMPRLDSGKIKMNDSDLDTVHLPSTRGIANFLCREQFEIVSWRRSYGKLGKRAVSALFPGQVPTMRIQVRLRQ